MSMCRQNYHEYCEAEVNKQINLELYASYVYLSMASHFDRDDVALKGASSYFSKNSAEEREHAQKLIKFQNQRGGRVVYRDTKMCDFIANNYLTKQVEAIKQIAGHVTNLKRVGPELGEFTYDKELS